MSKLLFIKVQLMSKHSRSKHYSQYVLFDLEKPGTECLLGYYCECSVGARTAGFCSHCMTVVWYFTYAQNQGYVGIPAEHLDHYFGEAPPIDEDDFWDDIVGPVVDLDNPPGPPINQSNDPEPIDDDFYLDGSNNDVRDNDNVEVVEAAETASNPTTTIQQVWD